jgi:SAM-dependent methyltransferase
MTPPGEKVDTLRDGWKIAMEYRSKFWRVSSQWTKYLADFIMRLSATEVNVGQSSTVPRAGWFARLYLWACEVLYSDLAWWYDWVSWLVSAGHWRRWQAGVWDEVRGSDVLEIGFGTGELLVQGAQRGLAMVGLDRSAAMQEVARQRAAMAHTPLKLILGDGRTLPLEEQSFDTVMATFPAGYILEADTLAEIHRVLRAEGRLVILGLWVEVNLAALGRLLPVFYGRPNAQAQEAMMRRVEAVGFRARWLEKRDGLFTIGVLVADREA